MFKVLVIISTALLMASAVTYIPRTKDIPNCMPDYRPGYKCMAFEKLP